MFGALDRKLDKCHPLLGAAFYFVVFGLLLWLLILITKHLIAMTPKQPEPTYTFGRVEVLTIEGHTYLRTAYNSPVVHAENCPCKAKGTR